MSLHTRNIDAGALRGPARRNRAALRAAISGLLLTPAFSARGDIIESVTEDIALARGRESIRSKGGPENNKLTNTLGPVRAGKTAFRHWVNTKGERSELAMQRTKIGGTYWYGWSMMLPEDFDHRGSDTIVMQLASWPTPRNGKFPHSANGPYLEIQPDGRLIMHLQPKGQDTDMVCDDFVVAEDVARLKGKWLDFVMHARWTGEEDGHFKLWLKVDDNNYLQKVDYEGPTWWNDEDTGPYFKMGAYMGEPGWKGPASRTVYTDEYRLGDEDSSFDEVAPGASERREEARQGGLEYRLYRSRLNDQDIPILVYTPPGYDGSAERGFPVVYNLHGAGGGSPARQWNRVHETLVHAMEHERVPRMIYVFVNGLGDTFFIDYADGALKVESSVIRELIPFIDANYRTIASREGRAIEGFSMGGAGALTLATKHPDLFGSVAAYGAALITADRALGPGEAHRWTDEDHFNQFSAWGAVERNADAIRAKLRIRIVCGEEDGLLNYNVRFKELLDRLHIDHEWVTVPEVAHDTRGLYRREGRASLQYFAAGLAPGDTTRDE
jgi:enterochelin esterase-like enzyme